MRFIILISFLVVFNGVVAQKVKIKDDVATVEGVDYCKVKKMSGLRNFAISNLKDEELVFVKVEVIGEGDLDIIVEALGVEDKVHIKNSLSLKKDVIQGLYSCGVIENGAFNAEKFKIYAKKYGTTNTAHRGVLGTQNSGTESSILVERNRSAFVQVVSNEIRQDFKTIGTYTTKTEVADGEIYKITSIYGSTGELIAQAKWVHVGAKTMTLTTLKNNRLVTLSCGDFDTDNVKVCADYLIKYMYI